MNLFCILNRMEQRPNNIVMIGKHRNNHYCSNRLILETSIKNYQNENYEMRSR